jgi:AraC-like DNA-binding protein
MSKTRQPVEACPALPSPVTALSFDLADGQVIPRHFHPEDQLVYACRGVMTVKTDQGTWVVPAQRAVWIPAKTPHGIVISGAVSMRTLYFRGQMVRGLPRACRVLNVSPLLKELILHACKFSKLSRRRKSQAHVIDLLLDQLQTVEAVPLQLPRPSDTRAVKVSELLARRQSGEDSIDNICREAGASKRTVERLFREETGLTLGRWRQQMRLLHSLELLAAGEKITHAAMEAGYSTPSAFIAMFKKTLGVSPSRYFAAT